LKVIFYKFLVVLIFLSGISCSNSNIQEVEKDVKSENITIYNYISSESELVELINDYRISKGLNALILDNYVSKVSENHDNYMIEKNAISHDLFEARFKDIVQNLGASKVAENVAYNFNTSNSTLQAWINSPEHKSNLEGNFTHFGISIKTNSSGIKFYTNIFMKK
jgi:uncharacterized protein YkwD